MLRLTQREIGAFVIALGVHVVLLRAAGSLQGSNLLFDRSGGAGDAIEVDVLSDDAPRAEVPPREAPPAEEARVAAVDREEPQQQPAAAATDPSAADPSRAAVDPEEAAQPEEAAGAGDAPAAEAPAAAAAAEPGALPAPGSADEYGAPPEAPPPGPVGPGAPPTWAMPGGLDLGPGPAAPTQAPRARPVDAAAPAEAVASTLRDRDKAVGITMPSTSVVTSAVSVATRSVPVPHNTRATFEVKLGPGGKVVSSRVIKHSGGGKAQWDAAAKSVAASLAGQNLELGDAAKSGATVIVNVTTKHVFPAGTSKAADVKPVCANQIINDLADSMDKSAGGTNTEPVVPLFQDENGRPCIPIGMAGISDTANIGAQKQVQVRTSAEVIVAGKKALPSSIQRVNKDPFWVDTGKPGPRPVMPFKMRKHKKDKEKKK